jgi:hypothetical protein
LARSQALPCILRRSVMAAASSSSSGMPGADVPDSGMRAATADASRRTSHGTSCTQPLSTPAAAVAPSKTATQSGPQTT